METARGRPRPRPSASLMAIILAGVIRQGYKPRPNVRGLVALQRISGGPAYGQHLGDLGLPTPPRLQKIGRPCAGRKTGGERTAARIMGGSKQRERIIDQIVEPGSRRSLSASDISRCAAVHRARVALGSSPNCVSAGAASPLPPLGKREKALTDESLVHAFNRHQNPALAVGTGSRPMLK